MSVGDVVVYRGRRHYVRGTDPSGVTNPVAHLEDVETGEHIQVSLVELAAGSEKNSDTHSGEAD